MKKILISLSLFLPVALLSCSEQNDCICTATQAKKAATAAASTYSVYDWGNACNSISQNDIPQLNDGNQYNIKCVDF